MGGLKRLLGRLVGSSAASTDIELGAHGDHWGCVFRAAEEVQLMDAIDTLIGNEVRADMRTGDGARLVCSTEEGLRLCVLVQGGKAVSAYPEGAEDERDGGWPVTVRGILAGEDGLEARITGECYGTHVNFFDTRYLDNRDLYQVGQTYRFHMAGFAYTLEPGSDTEAESDIGAKVSFRGAHAFMPASTSNEAAEIDDYWFHSPLEGESSMVSIAGKYLRAYPVVLALPEDFPMAITLYAASHTTSPGVTEVRPGEDLEGFLWLQGHLSSYEL